MHIIVVDCTLYLVWFWYSYLGTADFAKLQLAWPHVAPLLAVT